MIKAKYFVYLLKSTVSNSTYIGFTVDVKRRLRQHNGEITGGSKKTRKNRPWKLVLYVTGFEYERTALQYEFCIQHTKKHRRGTGVANKIKIMKALLKQDRICSTAPLNSEFKKVICFSDETSRQIWISS